MKTLAKSSVIVLALCLSIGFFVMSPDMALAKAKKLSLSRLVRHKARLNNLVN